MRDMGKNPNLDAQLNQLMSPEQGGALLHCPYWSLEALSLVEKKGSRRAD